MLVRDSRNFGAVTFTDPHRLGSVVMHDGKKIGIDALSDSLTGTFCDGLFHLLNTYQKYNYFEPLNLTNFIDFMSDLPTAQFDTPPLLFESSIKQEITKGTITREEVEGGDYACIPKNYDPLEGFEPGQFRI